MLSEFEVNITETITRTIKVTAESPADAERVAEENYNNNREVINVEFEANPLSRRCIFNGGENFEQ